MKAWFLPTALLLAGAIPAGATRHSFETLDGSGLDVRAESAFEASPSSGYVPIRVTIRNDSESPGRWTLISTSSAGPFGNRNTMTSTTVMAVPAGGLATFDVLAPVASNPDAGWNAPPRVQVSGRDIVDGGFMMNVTPTAGGKWQPFLAFSAALYGRHWANLKQHMSKSGPEPRGTEVDLDLLPPDWRALTGVDGLYLSDQDYEGLTPEQRVAVRDWVLRGGWLQVLSDSGAPLVRRDFGIAGEGAETRLGFGRVRLLAGSGGDVTSILAASVKALASAPASANAPSGPGAWPLETRVRAVQWNVPLLGAGLLAFALVVGPLNLFVFAGQGRRHRLFWTTPLISLVASGVFGLLIVLQEGFGGAGARAAVFAVDPIGRRMAVLQDETARTGVLLGRDFPVGSIGRLEPVSLANYGQQRRDSSYGEGNGRFTGDWFATRWRQAHAAEAVIPTRSEVSLQRESGGGATVLSRLPGPIDELYLVDAGGACWRAVGVRPGQRAALTPVEPRDLQTRLQAFPASPRLAEAWSNPPAPATFYGFASTAEFLPTLPAIRWQDDAALYLGPLTP